MVSEFVFHTLPKHSPCNSLTQPDWRRWQKFVETIKRLVSRFVVDEASTIEVSLLSLSDEALSPPIRVASTKGPLGERERGVCTGLHSRTVLALEVLAWRRSLVEGAAREAHRPARP